MSWQDEPAVPDPDVVFHENVPGQPNERLLHEKAWAEHCPYCFVAALAELPEVRPVSTGTADDPARADHVHKMLDDLLATTMQKVAPALTREVARSFLWDGFNGNLAGVIDSPTMKGVLSAAGYSEGPEPASQEEAVDPETEEQDPAYD